MNCNICNNDLQTVTVWQPGGPMGTRIRAKETYCPYCSWKGTSGAGKQLREAIRSHNESIQNQE